MIQKLTLFVGCLKFINIMVVRVGDNVIYEGVELTVISKKSVGGVPVKYRLSNGRWVYNYQIKKQQ